MKIIAFGDSITYGCWDSEGGWVQRLRRYLEQKYPEDILLYNLGVSGNQTDFLIKRIEQEMHARSQFFEEKTDTLLISIGTNDSAIIKPKKSKNWVDIKSFQENIREIIHKIKSKHCSLTFIGPFPVDESKTMPVAWNKEVTYTNEEIEKYSQAIKDICKKEGVLFIDIFNQAIKINYKRLLTDGCHPNSKGHELIFNIVKDFLEKKKII